MSAKSIFKRIINKFGYDIKKCDFSQTNLESYTNINIKQRKEITDIDSIAKISLLIPGMITPESGKILYTLCYMQELFGDVVEVGSWQGRSTSFLARATADSKNGNFFAIDHFRGNVGKEDYYIVKDKQLRDLKSGFIKNMEKLNLIDSINLLDMPNDLAIKAYSQNANKNGIRFLFLDGDHTYDGVKKDIDLFFPFLNKGAIVVFDDFSDEFPGVIQAVEKKVLDEYSFEKVMSYNKTLVVKI